MSNSLIDATVNYITKKAIQEGNPPKEKPEVKASEPSQMISEEWEPTSLTKKDWEVLDLLNQHSIEQINEASKQKGFGFKSGKKIHNHKLIIRSKKLCDFKNDEKNSEKIAKATGAKEGGGGYGSFFVHRHHSIENVNKAIKHIHKLDPNASIDYEKGGSKRYTITAKKDERPDHLK